MFDLPEFIEYLAQKIVILNLEELASYIPKSMNATLVYMAIAIVTTNREFEVAKNYEA